LRHLKSASWEKDRCDCKTSLEGVVRKSGMFMGTDELAGFRKQEA